MRQFTMATYKSTELGQIGQALGSTSQKMRRRKGKALKLKEKIKELKDKELTAELTAAEKAKLTRCECELKHELADIEALSEEVKHLKEIQEEKRAKTKKKKAEIFNFEESNMGDDEVLANLYGTPNETTAVVERNVEFNQM